MERRDFLKSATVAAAASAAEVLGAAPQNRTAPETSGRKPLGKIALEEHFMVPDFVEYFTETYPNISPEIVKPGLEALQDLGDRRIAILDRHHIDFVVLSLSGPGVQVEKDAAVALKKARAVNDFLAKEIQKRPTRYGGFAHLAMHDPAAPQTNWNAAWSILGFRAR